MRYLHLAAAYGLPPSLVLLCGLPGTGKTWVAQRLARPLRASAHRSDVRRKQIAGVPRTSRRREGFESGLYSAGMTERVYDSLREDAEAELRAGRTVIVDAAFPRRAQRAAFAEAARRAGRPVWILHLQAPEPVVRERLERRQADADEVSDADFGVYLRARESFEPPAEGECDGVVDVASGAMSGEDVAEALLEKMIAGVRAAR
jgi:predicted kinase